MNSEQYAAFVEDPDEEWAIDVDTTPLVNISTFGWTEGKPIQMQNLRASFHNKTLLRRWEVWFSTKFRSALSMVSKTGCISSDPRL